MFNGLADSINADTKNRPTATRWVEFTGSSECQDLVAAQGGRLPGDPDLDRARPRPRSRPRASTRVRSLIQVKDKTTFLFPITDHASDITAIMAPAMQAFLSARPTRRRSPIVNDQVNELFN